MVAETSSVSGNSFVFPASPSASANTGLGKSASLVKTPSSAPPGSHKVDAALTYTRIKSQSGGATVTVTCSPSVSASGTYYCNASVGYTAAISTVKILRDNQPITDANNKCLPGEAISLTVSLTTARNCSRRNFLRSTTEKTMTSYTKSRKTKRRRGKTGVKRQRMTAHQTLMCGV